MSTVFTAGLEPLARATIYLTGTQMLQVIVRLSVEYDSMLRILISSIDTIVKTYGRKTKQSGYSRE